MRIRLVDVYECLMQDYLPPDGITDTEMVLYELLKERPDIANISHQKMPSLAEHCEFVRSNPYQKWYLIQEWPETYEEAVFEKLRPRWVGSIYLTHKREVGIFVFKGFQKKGVGKRAIELLEQENPGKLYANIAPSNQASIAFFEGLGFNHIQNTYLRDDRS